MTLSWWLGYRKYDQELLKLIFRSSIYSVWNLVDMAYQLRHGYAVSSMMDTVYWLSEYLLHYAKSQPNGKLLVNSIKNGPYIRRIIHEPGDPTSVPPVAESTHEQTDDELTNQKQSKWKLMIKQFRLSLWEKKAKLFNEREKFKSTEGESIELYYHRFLKLMNDLSREKHFPEKIANNLKFLKNLQSEWNRSVTIVHQTKDLYQVDYTQLYDFLKFNQVECVTRSSTKELFTPFKDPEREFRSSRKHFKTLKEEVMETMAKTMEQYMSKTRADYGSGIARPKIEDKDNLELKGQFLKELRNNTFSGLDHEDVNEHIEKVLKIIDLFHIPNITIDQVMLRAFPMSLTGATIRWLRNKPSGSIIT
ncbi:hypothetical protein Tco_1209146 [Tanacetum coccineum]